MARGREVLVTGAFLFDRQRRPFLLGERYLWLLLFLRRESGLRVLLRIRLWVRVRLRYRVGWTR
jgi:hypothetical protein